MKSIYICIIVFWLLKHSDEPPTLLGGTTLLLGEGHGPLCPPAGYGPALNIHTPYHLNTHASPMIFIQYTIILCLPRLRVHARRGRRTWRRLLATRRRCTARVRLSGVLTRASSYGCSAPSHWRTCVKCSTPMPKRTTRVSSRWSRASFQATSRLRSSPLARFC